LIALAFAAGLAVLILSFVLKAARMALRLVGGLLCVLALLAAALLMFVLIPSM
jgi:hypothetical protein